MANFDVDHALQSNSMVICYCQAFFNFTN